VHKLRNTKEVKIESYRDRNKNREMLCKSTEVNKLANIFGSSVTLRKFCEHYITVLFSRGYVVYKFIYIQPLLIRLIQPTLLLLYGAK
jgi:hypothetical protein